MADNGIILKLEVGGTQKRFDATVDPHYHIRCLSCGKVNDIEIPVMKDIDKTAAELSHYQVLGHHIEFSGICSECSEQEAEQLVN